MGIRSLFAAAVPSAFAGAVDEYVDAGVLLGTFIARLPERGMDQGLPSYPSRLHEFQQREQRYANLGYRTIELAKFIEHRASPAELAPLLRKRRLPGEAAVLYGKVWETLEVHLPRNPAVVNLLLSQGQQVAVGAITEGRPVRLVLSQDPLPSQTLTAEIQELA